MGGAQRVSLAKIAVLHRTSCDQQNVGLIAVTRLMRAALFVIAKKVDQTPQPLQSSGHVVQSLLHGLHPFRWRCISIDFGDATPFAVFGGDGRNLLDLHISHHGPRLRVSRLWSGNPENR